MDRQQMALLVAGVAVALAVVVTAVLVGRGRRRLARELGASREDVASLRGQVEDLSRRLDATRPSAAADRAEEASREFVITTLPGDSAADTTADATAGELTVSSAGGFASVALAESVVRLLSLGYGVRRALSPENRNRIRFEMRQEVKRARRQRRRDLRDAKRHLRAQHSGGERADLRSDAA